MNKFMIVGLQMETVVPQDMVVLAGAGIVNDLMQGVVNGELPASLNIQLASPEVLLGDVSDYMKRRWLDWLAEDVGRVKAERERLSEIGVGDDNCILEPFIVWDRGTPLSEVEAWFK